jgi:hypothetical protein
MELKGNNLTDCGYVIATFSEELTKDAKIKLATRFEHSEAIFNKVEELLSNGHIKHVFDQLVELQLLFSVYKQNEQFRKRKTNAD